MAQESVLQPYQHYNRTDVLEGRVSGQERTLAVLVEQALRIKEEVAASLHATQGSVLAEALSHRLLESHISTITHIVKQLSVDIQALESNITQRDSVTSGTSMAVQSLDQKNMAGIGDLRGRVARCDASISKLSADVRSGEQQTVSLRQEVAELRSALDGRLKEMELKLYQVEGRLEGSLAEQSQGHRRTLSELQSQVKLLEARSSGGLRDAIEEIDSVRKWAEQQLHASEKTNTQGNHVLHTSLQDKLVEAEARLAERLRVVESRAEHSETHQQRSSHGQLERLKRSETKVSGRINSLESSLRQELQLVKQDYQEGFKSVHDAIDSLRQIVDARSRLDKEILQKDLRHIRRKMVGLGDP